MLNIAFRADASLQIGTGHVMRCLTLANALRERGARCHFICRRHSGHLLDLIQRHGHQVTALTVPDVLFEIQDNPVHAAWLGTDWETDAKQTYEALGQQHIDWLVVDHYALDRRWEQASRPLCQKLMVIDDLADRPHDCDLLLDQNLGRSSVDYGSLLCSRTQMLIGPMYALLRPEFAELREYSLLRRTQHTIKNLLITMGGVDKDNTTGQVLESLKFSDLPPEIDITVVMGPHAPWLEQVQAQATQMPWNTLVMVGVNNMAKLMADSDFAIGAAGSTSWERCCLGLPTIMMILAENQRISCAILEQSGAGIMIDIDRPLAVQIKRALQCLINDSGIYAKFIYDSAKIADGCGLDRVISKMINYSEL